MDKPLQNVKFRTEFVQRLYSGHKMSAEYYCRIKECQNIVMIIENKKEKSIYIKKKKRYVGT